jgi:hypothetical protein
MRQAARSSIALVAAGILALGVLSGCSRDSASVQAAPDPVPSTLAGGDPSTWSPVDITPAMNGRLIQLRIGQTARFTDLPAGTTVTVESSDTRAVRDVQPMDSAGVTTAAGITAVGAGAAHVIVWSGPLTDSATVPLANYVVQTFPADATQTQPSTDAAVAVGDAGATVALAPGQIAVFTQVPASLEAKVESSNDMVVMMLPQKPGAAPALIAVGPGDAKAVVTNGSGAKQAAASFTVS